MGGLEFQDWWSENWRTALVVAVVGVVVLLGAFLAIPKPSTDRMTAPREDLGAIANPGETFKHEELGLTMVWCPPGTYQMGSPDTDLDAVSAEKPQHAVELTSGFWLGQTEVTQSQWKSVMGTEPWKGKPDVKEGPDFPALHVPWYDAQKFCTRLTNRDRRAGRLTSSQAYRLPTEAQWEYACRAGTTTNYSFGDDPLLLTDDAWYERNASEQDQPYGHQVATKHANPWNLYDMHGNVWEWCADVFDEHAYENLLGVTTDPVGDIESDYRVLRGGSWSGADIYARSAYRYVAAPGVRNGSVGFRVSMTP